MSNYRHAVVRYLNTCYLALKRVSIIVKPYHPYRIILLFGEGYLCQSVRVEQLPYGIYDVLAECLYLVGEFHLQTLCFVLFLCVG